MTGLAFFFYAIFSLRWMRVSAAKHKKSFLMTWIWIGILSIGIAAIQLIPSIEFFARSTRQGYISLFSANKIGGYSIGHLIQFILPYGLGDVRTGNFPVRNWAMSFWETFAYIGITPILLALISIMYQKDRFIRILWLIIGILFLFVFENNSPINFIFSVAPFSWFRIQSRFLSFISFFLILLSGYVFERIRKKFGIKHILVLSIFISSVADILYFGCHYNPMYSYEKVIQKPEILSTASIDGRLTSVQSEQVWFDRMYSKGWTHPSDYISYLNGGLPNFFMIHHIPTVTFYSGFSLDKQNITFAFTQALENFSLETNIATLSSSALTTLKLNNVSTIVSPFILSNNDVSNQKKMYANGEQTPYYVYTLIDRKDKYYLSYKPKTLFSVEEYKEAIQQSDLLQTYDAIISSNQTLSPSSHQKGILTVRSETPTDIRIHIHTDADVFFVASIYFYRGWKAKLDQTDVPIYPANLSGMGVYIPKGDHDLVLQYEAKSLLIGAIISCISLVIYVVYTIRSFFRSTS
jgi:hypothetical protein